MSEVADLQARIIAALDRIGQGLDGLARPVAPAEDMDEGDSPVVQELRAALDEERTANAQLEERVVAIKQKQDTTVSALVADVERLRAMVEAQEATVARLTRVNAELRANNAALRSAISNNVAEPHLVNKSMMAELEALRAAQAADRAELDAVLGELAPMIDSAMAGATARTEETADA